MAKRTYIGVAPNVAQVWKGTVTTTTNAHTYILTLTDEVGGTVAITYVVANPPDTTVTLVATGIVNAWNASTDPRVAAITATQSSGQVILTADTSGVPFSVAATGTGTWSGTGNTTENSGSEDYNTPANWLEVAVPASSDDVVIASGTISYGLNQSGVSIGGFTIAPGHTGTIGANGEPLRVAPTSLSANGTGTYWINIGSANISPRIVRTGSGSGGTFGFNLLGSNIATLTVESGSVGVATNVGETATVATVNLNGGTLTLGSGVTLTTWNQTNGTGELNAAATTISVAGGTLTTKGSGAVTTLTNSGANVISNSSGTITTLNQNKGTTDFNQSKTARTITTTNLANGTLLLDSAVITQTNKISVSGRLTLTAAYS